MQTVDNLEISYTQLERTEKRRGLLDKLEQKKLVIIIALVAIALCARIYHLDAAGLAEDEVNKITAIRDYKQGDFTVNAEHPLLMKTLCLVSLQAAATWNGVALDRLGLAISEETALRLPNAFFGALTVVPLFLLAAYFLGFRAALVAATLWALGLNAIWFNRVAKEDTLLVFFMLWAFYLYARAKDRPRGDLRGEGTFYSLAGAAFGLMMASKYLPHFLGVNAIFYHLAGYDSRNNRPLTRRTSLIFFAAMFLAFAMVNWAVFLPQAWSYISAYLGGNLLTHRGYRMGETIYANNMSETPGGLPWYTYYLYLAIKLPLPLLAAFLIGLIEIFRHRRSPELQKSKDEDYGDGKGTTSTARARGYLFLRVSLVCWLFPMALVGGKFLRYTLSLMPFIYMTAAVGTLVIWRWLSSSMDRSAIDRRFVRPLAAVAVALIFVGVPAAEACASLPYPSLYANALSRQRTGYFFPHDEFYDLGARESIKYIADHAGRGARIASEIPGVVQYYLERYNRTDIRSETLSNPEFSLDGSCPDYVLLQPGRLYFENQENFRYIERAYPAVQASRYKEAITSQVFRTSAISRQLSAISRQLSATDDQPKVSNHR